MLNIFLIKTAFSSFYLGLKRMELNYKGSIPRTNTVKKIAQNFDYKNSFDNDDIQVSKSCIDNITVSSTCIHRLIRK